jgi:hypothetical protein
LRGGNVNWLEGVFIRHMARRGRQLLKLDLDIPPLQATDVRLFSTLLEAGWTDLKFPIKDHHGESLEPLDLYFEERVKWMLKANSL